MMQVIGDKVARLMNRVSQQVILPLYQNLQKQDISEKAPGDLVTIADLRSEEALTAGLSKILPGTDIVGEEACAQNPALLEHLSHQRVWIIDPIDGTGNFAAGKSPFGIIIALAEYGETVAGWLYDPLTHRICYATKDEGAWINGTPVRCQTHRPEKPIAAISTLFMDQEQREQTIAKVAGKYEIVDIPRCAAEQYPRLVNGTNDISIFERTLAWDHAAGILFLNEAGGKAARWDGSAYRVTDKKTGLLGASSPQIWEDAAQIFSQ